LPSLFHDAASVAALLIITQAMIAEAPKGAALAAEAWTL